ncbi:MAG: 16S rRNA (guanine(527)-N(7))-methyltransferase RsmG [Candidatus Caldatribacteriaceae bacterium]
MDGLRKILQEGLESLGVAMEEGQKERILDFVRCLYRGNQTHNLTGFKSEEGILIGGVLDSLSVFSLRDLPLEGRVVDVGTGGGIPGIPLKIAHPSLKLYLVEANIKKCSFLEEALRLLALEDVYVLRERAETLAHDSRLREQFDYATSRAVGEIREILELTVPFLRPGGLAFYYKGREADKEIEEARGALRELHCEVVAQRIIPIPFTSRATHFVIVRKEAPTPSKYPRRPGIPKKRPL